MFQINRFMVFIFLVALSLTPRAQDGQKVFLAEKVSTYHLGPGDKISVQVFGEPEMSIEAVLSDAGTFIHPLLGEINAAGLTIGELSIVLGDTLKGRYILEPKVSANILEYRDFFVNGEVEHPGAYNYEPGLTVNKAIAIAGGFTQRASRTKIFLTADRDPTHKPIEVNLDAPIRPGDILMIEESLF